MTGFAQQIKITGVVKDAVTGEFIRDYPMTAEEFAKKTYFVYEVLEAQEIAADDVRFKIEEVYEPFSSQPAERNGSEQYFRQITRDGLPAYELVTDAELPHDETLYQRFITLQKQLASMLASTKSIKRSRKASGSGW